MPYRTDPDTVLATVRLLAQAGARRVRIIETFFPAKQDMALWARYGLDIAAINNAGCKVEWENAQNLGQGSKYVRMKVPWGGYIYPAYDLNHSFVDCDTLRFDVEAEEPLDRRRDHVAEEQLRHHALFALRRRLRTERQRGSPAGARPGVPQRRTDAPPGRAAGTATRVRRAISATAFRGLCRIWWARAPSTSASWMAWKRSAAARASGTRACRSSSRACCWPARIRSAWTRCAWR